MNTDWLTNKDEGVFTCPACLRRYRPWKDQPNYTKANKVWVIKRTDIDDWKDHRPAEIQNMHVNDDGEAYMFIPAKWRSSNCQQLENNFKAISLQIDEELQELEGIEKLNFLIDKVKRDQSLVWCRSEAGPWKQE